MRTNGWHKWHKGALSVFAAVLAAASIAQDDMTYLDVYRDYAAGYWWDEISGRIDLYDTTYYRSGKYSIRVYPLSGVRFVHKRGGISRYSPYLNYLEFYVHGGGNYNQQFYVCLYVNDSACDPIVVSVPYNGRNAWYRYRLALSDLMKRGGTYVYGNITGVKFYALSWTNSFWLDDIRFGRYYDPPSNDVSITADFSSSSGGWRLLSKRMFGYNLAAWDWCGWEKDNPNNYNYMKQSLINMGITFLRYPGGAASCKYDWVLNKNIIDNENYNTDSSTTYFYNLLRDIGAEGVISLNYGSGKVYDEINPGRSAYHWIQHSVSMGNRVAYWEVGNECYGYWEYDGRGTPNDHNPDIYALFVIDLINRIQGSQDSRIRNMKIGVVGAWNELYGDGGIRTPWSPTLLSKLRNNSKIPHFYDIHFYATNAGKENDSHLLYAARYQLPMVIDKIRTDFMDANLGQRVPIYILEINNAERASKQTVNIYNALFLLEAWGRAVNKGVQAFAWWGGTVFDTQRVTGNSSSTLYGYNREHIFAAIKVSYSGCQTSSTTYYPIYYALTMLKQFARPNWNVKSIYVPDNPLISAFLAYNPNGPEKRILLLNWARSTSINVNITVSGASLPYQIRSTVYDDSYYLSPTLKSITPTSGTISLTMYPHSVVVLEL
ncbi:hypothetical protein HRbin15_01492 [bacterium HR15]|nr:hypothetical protein HRbin15_01492 [bacterium HR15]